MKIKRYFCVLIVIILLLAGCQSADPGDTAANQAPPSSGTQGAGSTSQTPSDSDFPPLDDDDYVDLADELYKICYNQPETLASTMSCFPSLLRACDVDTDDPLEIDELLSTSANGGEIQDKLLDALQQLLDNPETEMRVAVWSGRARMLGMETIDPNQPLTPANIRLFWYEETIVFSQILGIAHPLEDGSKEFGYYYLPGGFQRLEPIIDDSLQQKLQA